MSIHPSSPLDSLLRRLFDYAGMFPPAQRSFEDALKESASLATTLVRPWLVASDIVLDTRHARRLAELNISALGYADKPSICVLVTEPYDQVLSVVESLERSSPPVDIASFELKISAGAAAEAIATWSPLSKRCSALLALEPDLSGENWQENLKMTVVAISQSGARAALKCRLTGPTGISAERCASAIIAACDAQIDFKVTGGLHHPIVAPDRHQYPMGFVNVVAAVMFRRVLGDGITHSALTELLTNSSWNAFSWHSGLSYGDYNISLEQLRAAKGARHFSIGSCSLHEPDLFLGELVDASIP